VQTLRRLARACRLLVLHLPLIATIVLFVWFPATCLIDSLLPPDADAQRLQAAAWVELLFGPIATAGLLQALAALEEGDAPGPLAALRAGFDHAGRLLKARLAAGVLMLLGFLALVVPGLILMVRWALLDAVVVLEDTGVRAGLARSARLTRGRRWSLLVTGVLCLAGGWGVDAVLELPKTLAPALDVLPMRVAIDCAGNVVGSVLDIVLFLFYVEARREEAARDAAVGGS